MPRILPAWLPDFSRRYDGAEWMDDFAISDERLRGALRDLRLANRWLGGNAAVTSSLRLFLRPAEREDDPVTVLDLATGLADLPVHLVRWTKGQGYEIDVTGIDANPQTVAYARSYLRQSQPLAVRRHLRVEVADALDLPYDDASFDVVTAMLFMHHLSDEDAVRLVREMMRVARRGVVVCDLHRHPLAYAGLKLLTELLPVSPMFRHDGLVSVRRAFTRDDLETVARRAQLTAYRIRWHWAFRWTLTASTSSSRS